MSIDLIEQISGIICNGMEPERAELKAAAVKTLIHDHYMGFVSWLTGEDQDEINGIYKEWAKQINNY